MSPAKTVTETYARIRWEPTQYGGWTGHVGTARAWLFQVWLADPAADGWQLDSTLPGQFGSGWHRCDGDPDELKAEAERWLEEFVSSLGAVFPDEGDAERDEVLRKFAPPQPSRPSAPAPSAPRTEEG